MRQRRFQARRRSAPPPPAPLSLRGHADHASEPLQPLEVRAHLAVAFQEPPASSPALIRHDPVVVADFDGDGRDDIAGVAVNDDRVVHLLRSSGDGTFETFSITLNVRVTSLAAGDLIPGGGAEIVALGGAGTAPTAGPTHRYRAVFARVLEFETSGLGALVRRSQLGITADTPGGFSGPSQAAVADFAPGAAREVAFQATREGPLLVLSATSPTTIEHAQTVALPDGAAFHQAADLDGGGELDVIVRSASGYHAYVGALSAPATPAVLALSPLFDWRFGDTDADGLADAVSEWTPPAQRGSLAADRYTVLRVKHGAGDGGFGAIRTIARVNTGPNPAGQPASGSSVRRDALIVGPDLNADGRGDVLFYHLLQWSDRSTSYVQERTGALTSTPSGWDLAQALPVTAYAGSSFGPVPDSRLLGFPVLADIDDDGRADLIDLSSPGGARVYINVNV